MPFTIQAGQSVNLNTAAQISGQPTPLQSFIIGLTWEDDYASDHSFDLDAMAFLLNEDGQCTGDQDFIFYNQLSHPTGGVIHKGDDLTEGTIDECIEIHLEQLPSDIVEVALVMSIIQYDSDTPLHFDLVEKPTAFVLSMNNDELCDYPITINNAADCQVAVAARLTKNADGWHFNASTTGVTGTLADCARQFGINV